MASLRLAILLCLVVIAIVDSKLLLHRKATEQLRGTAIDISDLMATLRNGRLEPVDTDAGGPESIPANILPNDLWGIHDLVLAGYGAVFMTKGSEGASETQKAAYALAGMLPKVHPYEPCRKLTQQALANATSEESAVIAVADASWACLPAKFNEHSFDAAYTKDSLGNYDRANSARNPSVLDVSVLGACQRSAWPRTCSYWSSLHAMAFRADALNLGTEFMHAVVPLLASGSTFCAGCTLHFSALHDTVLSKSFMRDQAAGF